MQATARKASRGFTLVEVLVALVLVSLLSLLAWRALDGMGRAGEITVSNEQSLQRVQIALAQWAADLDALADTSATTAIAQPLDFDGQSMRLTRYSSQQNAADATGIQVVAWTLRNTSTGRVWQRWTSPTFTDKNGLQAAWDGASRWSKTPLPEDDARTVMLIPVDSWQVFYYRGDAWSNPQSAIGATGANASRIPDGVQLILNLPAASAQSLGGKLTRYWIAPTQGATK